MTHKNFKLLFLLSLPLSIYTNSSYAECSRDDIDHYLDKGFTPEQITSMCTTPPINNTVKVSDEKLSNEEMTETVADEKKSVNKHEQFLKEAIKGRNVFLTNDALQYTLKVCFEYGEQDLYGFAPKACPVIKFTIARKDLEIIRSQKKYIFFGADEIKIKGSIEREVISGLENNKSEEIKIINELLETGNQTTIPIRDDISSADVEQVLLQLSH